MEPGQILIERRLISASWAEWPNKHTSQGYVFALGPSRPAFGKGPEMVEQAGRCPSSPLPPRPCEAGSFPALICSLYMLTAQLGIPTSAPSCWLWPPHSIPSLTLPDFAILGFGPQFALPEMGITRATSEVGC